jgi:hypothetical protein
LKYGNNKLKDFEVYMNKITNVIKV